jgi:2-methylcitrate dehydratase PrpD
VPAAGGVQRAFGTAAKSLQVAFVVEAGLRAAGLAEAGASADPGALDQWIELVGGDPAAVAATATKAATAPRTGAADAPTAPAGVGAPAVPDGLAIKLYPCCYALQRPISAVIDLKPVEARDVKKITVRTPRSSLKPLIHSAPRTGLEGKFSLEYGIAAAILDNRPDLNSFSDEAVKRPEATRLMRLIEVTTPRDGEGLLDGELTLEIETHDQVKGTTLALPPGAPGRPPTDAELQAKLQACGLTDTDTNITWETAAFDV